MGSSRHAPAFMGNGDDAAPPSFDRAPTISRRLQGGRGALRTDPADAMPSFDRSKTMGIGPRKARNGGGEEQGSAPRASRSSKSPGADAAGRAASGFDQSQKSTAAFLEQAQFNRVNSMIQHSSGAAAAEGAEGEEEAPRFNRTLSMVGKSKPKKAAAAARMAEPDPPEPAANDMEEHFGRSMTLGSKPRFKSSGTTQNGGSPEAAAPPGSSGRERNQSPTAGPGQRRGLIGAQDAQSGPSRERSPLSQQQQQQQQQGSAGPVGQVQLKPALKKSSTVAAPRSRSSDAGAVPAGAQQAGEYAAGVPPGYAGEVPGGGPGDMRFFDGGQGYGQPAQLPHGRGRRRDSVPEEQYGSDGMEEGAVGYSPAGGLLQGVQQPGTAGEGGEPVVLPMLPPPGAPQVVQCQKCGQLLEVPTVLPPAKKGVQKLRCGKCLRVSRFQVNPADPRSAASIAEVDLAEESATPRLPPSLPGGTHMWDPDLRPGQVHRNSTAPSPEAQAQYYVDGSASGPFGGGVPRVQGSAMQQRVAYPGQQGMGQPEMGVGPARVGPGGVDRFAGGTADSRPTFSRRVVVNGEPIPDDFVQVAEARVGPIHPGNYWYDAIAGFWGEMGGPCLGIVPPGVDFGVPLPRNCAGGSTGVLVNGRELHHKDLERLKKRGLPPQPDLAYRVEINGNVFDWESGEFLMALGKLAPSLETRKRGGGMKMPE